jgi:8-oxo-dGTP pyrophosphatase MutT (NUDIX family)
MDRWRVIQSRVVLDRLPWLRVHEQRLALPDGRVIEDWLLTEEPEVVLAFAVTPDQRALFVEQYKHGTGEMMWALPAGYLDVADPDPLEACRRELLEETGHASKSWESLGAYVLDPNRWHNRLHFFLARDAIQVAEQDLDPTEDIQVHFVPLGEVTGLLGTRIREVGSAAGVLLALNRLASVKQP